MFTYSSVGFNPDLGSRVLVPFGSGERIGFVVGLTAETTLRKVKAIRGVLGSHPSVTNKQMGLAF